MDYEKRYKDVLQAAKHALDCEKQGLVTTDRVLIERMFPELKESEDEKIRKTLIEMFSNIGKKDWRDIPTEKIIAWLEKQKEIDKEIVFRPLAGTDIIAAARQALEKIEIGKEVVLAFNGAYISVNGKTVAEICNEYFSWTEKQDEKKVTTIDFNANDWYVSKVDGKIHDMTYDAADKLEAKFHKDDWIVNNITKDVFLIKSINNGYCTLEDIKGNIISPCLPFESEFHLWTIEDAKDGDVLVDVYGNIGIFQKNDDFDWSSYCSLGSNGGFRCFAIEHELDRSHPATKEQRDLLFQKMKEDGYEWDAEKKELKKIEQPKLTEFEDEIKDMMDDYRDAIDENDATIEEVKERAAYLLSLIPCKHAWSVEDSSKVQRICQYLDEAKKYYADITEVRECVEWLKLLEDRVQPKPTEWSDEDERMCQETIDWFEKKCFPYALEHENPARESIKWLKSLKERVQPKQKWSEEDEKIVEQVYNCASLLNIAPDKIDDVKKWLKSLKERLS